MHLRVRGTTGTVSGELAVPASKYHAHRALIAASLAPGTSRIVGGGDAGHVQSTIGVLRSLGTVVEPVADGFLVRGGPYSPRDAVVSVGSSGTTLYFLTGLAALADAPVTITGQKYLQRRPVGPLLEALGAMGVRLTARDGRPPITVEPSRPHGGRVVIPGTLSQWISGLLLLAPFATRPTVIEVAGVLNEAPYLALTVEMMRRFGLEVDVSADWRRFAVAPRQQARPATVVLPPDVGSAAFGIAAAALHPAAVTFSGLGAGDGEIDHPEARVLDVMRAMGVPTARDASARSLTVAHDGAPLRGVDVDCREMPDMLPVLAALAAFAEGETRFHNVAHVRLKESDRVTAMLQLGQMGAGARVRGDDVLVRGAPRLSAAPLSSYNDHRVLMALAVAASRADGDSTLTYPHAYRISYPAFLDDLRSIGLDMAVERDDPRRRTGAFRRRESVAIDRAAAVPITDQLRRWARERPAELALVEVDGGVARAWTWRKLSDDVDRAAALLLELGVAPGEPVAFQLPNVGEFVVVALAALRIGAVCCPLMPIFRERELALVLQRAEARVLIVADRFRGRDHVAEAAALLSARGAPAVEHVLVVALGGAPRDELPTAGAVRWQRLDDALGTVRVDTAALDARRPRADAPAQLLFTSGTTGEPKGVVHRSETLTRAAAMEVEHLGLGRDDRVFVPSPLAHQTGFLYGMWLALFLGVPQILQPRWEPGLAAAALRDWGGSFVQAATPFLSDLVSVVEDGAERPAALRVFVVTGATVPRVLAERATSVLGAAVCGAWGSTETCLGTLAAPDDPPEKAWGSDGRPLAGVDVRIADDAGRVLEPGREGNFELLSRCFFDGYRDRPDLTADAFTADGWFRTGDLAVLDEDGFLRITGRVKDVVNRGGEKIPVAEIEQLLHAHPAVAEAAIVAMPAERLGERACAFVVPTAGARFDVAAMAEHLDRSRVARQYWPEHLEIVDALPRTASGKVQKFILRDRAREFAQPPAKEPIA